MDKVGDYIKRWSVNIQIAAPIATFAHQELPRQPYSSREPQIFAEWDFRSKLADKTEKLFG
ncbi:MAG: hypothetical protein IPN18_16095 [Ignavibacteriales bacterium]|nr:hypothetical protein [Ignavibacteriales bacterium]